jgi:hypothetical protein
MVISVDPEKVAADDAQAEAERPLSHTDSVYLEMRKKYAYKMAPGAGQIFRWDTGAIYAIGATENLPGMMGMESGAIVVDQQFENFLVSVYGGIDKIGYFRGLATSYNFGGSLTYDFTEQLGLTVFGQYYHTSAPNYRTVTPAMMGYIGTPAFGGYFNLRSNNGHWGVKLGAQSYQTLGPGNHWRTQPIVMPYYKLNNGAELGVDVGGILYNLLRSVKTESNWGQPGNPTIAPPRPTAPKVRPMP